jgi:hypothetical protein
MDLLSLILAATMAVGSAGATTGSTTTTTSGSADSPSTTAPAPTDGDDARSHIIEIG